MIWTPNSHFSAFQHNMPATLAQDWGTTVTAHTSAHTKGDWVEVISSTTYQAGMLALSVHSTAATGVQTDSLVDIGIGTAGNEVVLIGDILCGYKHGPDNVRQPDTIIIPDLHIPEGTRISARMQSLVTGGKTSIVQLCVYSGASSPAHKFTVVDTYGVSTASSQGTSVTAGLSNAFGSWTNVGSTTTKDYGGVFLIAQGNTSALSNNMYYFEVGISSTTLARWYIRFQSGEVVLGQIPGVPYFGHIPKSSQLQVRSACNNSGSVDSLGVGLYCFA